MIPGASVNSTIRLTPSEGGTRVSYSCARSKGPLISRIINNIGARLIVPSTIMKGLKALHARIEEDIAQGRVVQPTSTDIPSEEIEKAVAESLTS